VPTSAAKCQVKQSVLVDLQVAEIGLADAGCVLQHGLEHRLELAGRSADDLEHLGGRGLLLQRLGELAGARLDLVEQPHVLDRDHRLVGEGGDQVDLLLRERLDPGAGQEQHADRGSLAQQRNAERGAIVAERQDTGHVVFGVGLDVVHMNDASLEQGAPDDRSAARLDGDALQVLLVLQRLLGLGADSVAGCQMVGRASRPPDVGDIRVAQPRRRFDQRVEHHLQVEGRATDHLEHVGGGGLPLQRLAQLVEQPRVLDGDDGLLGEVADQLDLLIGEGAHLLPVDVDVADQLAFLEHRHQQQGAGTGQLDHRDGGRVAVAVGPLRCQILDLDDLLGALHAAETGPRARPHDRLAAPHLGKSRWRVVHGDDAEARFLAQIHRAESCLANSCRVAQHGVEYGRELAR
jgi:hypothetical protein